MNALTLPGVDTLPPAHLRQAALGQWDTPPDRAAQLVDLVAVEGATVLEPSAGRGNIVAALLDAGAERVVAVEVDPARVAHLRRRFSRSRVEVIESDFLAFRPEQEFTIAVGNPPYDRGNDTRHVAHLLTMVDEAALLLRTVFLHGKERRELIWSRCRLRSLEPCAERVAFGDEAGMIDVSLFHIERCAPAVHSDVVVRWR